MRFLLTLFKIILTLFAFNSKADETQKSYSLKIGDTQDKVIVGATIGLMGTQNIAANGMNIFSLLTAAGGVGTILYGINEQNKVNRQFHSLVQEHNRLKAGIRTSIRMNKICTVREVVKLLRNYETSNDRYLDTLKKVNILMEQIRLYAVVKANSIKVTHYGLAIAKGNKILNSPEVRSKLVSITGGKTVGYNLDFAYRVFNIELSKMINKKTK